MPDAFRILAKVQFDARQLDRRRIAGERRALIRIGGYVRKVARNSIKKPRRKRLSELTPTQRKIHARKLRMARRGKGERPVLPYASAPAGQPPRSATGILKNTIFFAYDRGKHHVVIGPIRARTGTADKLEYGGNARLPHHGKPVSMHFAGNPFMRPALGKSQKTIPPHFRNVTR